MECSKSDWHADSSVDQPTKTPISKLNRKILSKLKCTINYEYHNILISWTRQMIPNPAGKVNYCCAAKVQTKYQVCVKPPCIQCFVVHLYWRDFIWYCVVENIAHIYIRSLHNSFMSKLMTEFQIWIYYCILKYFIHKPNRPGNGDNIIHYQSISLSVLNTYILQICEEEEKKVSEIVFML